MVLRFDITLSYVHMYLCLINTSYVCLVIEYCTPICLILI